MRYTTTLQVPKGRLRRVSLALAALVGLFLAASGASAAVINYGDFPGVGPGEVSFLNVTENSTTDPTPLYGAPTRVGNQLLFFPNSFTSYSANGTADTTSGTLQMIIQAPQGMFLQIIVINEIGDYSLLGWGTDGTSAGVSGLLTVTDLTPGTNGTASAMLNVLPASPYTLPGDTAGEFIGSEIIDPSGKNITKVQINFNNILQTTSEFGTTAFIEKKFLGTSIEVFVPEPATLSLLALGGAILIHRRRKPKYKP